MEESCNYTRFLLHTILVCLCDFFLREVRAAKQEKAASFGISNEAHRGLVFAGGRTLKSFVCTAIKEHSQTMVVGNHSQSRKSEVEKKFFFCLPLGIMITFLDSVVSVIDLGCCSYVFA